MGATRQPFIYEAVQTPEDERFSTSKFDPKRVTRSSYEQKAPKRKQRGPLVSVNRHPEYVSLHRSTLCIPVAGMQNHMDAKTPTPS